MQLCLLLWLVYRVTGAFTLINRDIHLIMNDF